jgi:hypothetical protein
MRRLFSVSGVNPRLGTLAGVAAALGLRVAVVPLRPDELDAVTGPLRSGHRPTPPGNARVSTGVLRPTGESRARYSLPSCRLFAQSPGGTVARKACRFR